VRERARKTGQVITALFKSLGDRVLASWREKVKGLGTAQQDNKAQTDPKITSTHVTI